MGVTSSPASSRRAATPNCILIGGIIAAACTFLYRLLTIEFTNDHFVHLSRAQQIVFGEVPDRDFFDPGLFMQYYASAAALLWSGHNLFGEAILTAGFIALGAALTFYAAARLSGSCWLASAVTFVGAMAAPRLYGYPKVFFYVLAIAAAWLYVQRPGRARLVGLAAITAAAFLFRHDHGLYIGLSTIPLLAVLHWGRPKMLAEAAVVYGLAALLFVLPFLIFVQSTRGLVRYVGSISPQMQGASTLRVNWLPIDIDPGAPLVAVAPPAGPRVNVRWTPGLDEATRRAREQRHNLLSPEHVEDSTWSYVLGSLERDRIAALVDDPVVADTHGINRASRAIEVEIPGYLRLQRRFPLLRLQIAPGVLTRGNARAWFYYTTLLLPMIGLAMVGWLLRRNRIDRPQAAVAAMACGLCLIVVQTLVRGSPDSRLADVANPIGVVAAWLAGRWFAEARNRGVVVRGAGAAVVLAAVVMTIWSVATESDAATSVQTSRLLAGPSRTWQRLIEVNARLRARPIDNWDRDAAGWGGMMRYVYECTAPSDRLFVTWFAPDAYFFTERAFGGGQVFLTNGWHAAPDEQRESVELLRRQRVPIVLESIDVEYERYFPIIAGYLRGLYTEVPIQSDSSQGYRVLVDPRLAPRGTYEPLGLPCYR